MDETIAKLLAQAASQGGNVFIFMCGEGGGSYGAEPDADDAPGMAGPDEIAAGPPSAPIGAPGPDAGPDAGPPPAEKIAPAPKPKPKNPPLRGEHF
jgi:hypothetical protein